MIVLLNQLKPSRNSDFEIIRSFEISGQTIKFSTAFRKHEMQVRRVDSVEGGSFIFWEVFLSPEALTRAPKA